jgi:hypothetical protein
MSRTATAPAPGMQDTGNWMNILVVVMQVFARSIEVFLRRDFGHRYLGLQGALVLVLVPVFSLLFPGYDLRPLLLLLPAYLFFCVIHRLRQFRVRRNVPPRHSYYNGRPLLNSLLRKLDESWIKRFCEPFLVVVAGGMVGDWNVPLGAYLSVAGICLFFVENLLAIRESQQATDLNDALIEQQLRAERFRHMRGDY